MKTILFILIFSFGLSIGQNDSNNHIGQINNPQTANSNEPQNITIYSASEDRSKPTLIKSTYNGKDTTFELVYDTTFKGTTKELTEAIQSGVMEKYYVIDKDGKLYERINIVQFEESFFEQYWTYIGIAILLGFGIFHKLSSNKDSVDEEEDDTKLEK
jgi:hypothetical protein